MRVHHRLEDHLHDRLRHAVGHRGNAERVACRRCPSESRRAARAAGSTSPTTSDSRPCRGCPSDPVSNAASDSPSTPAAPRFALTRWYASQTSCFGMSYGFASGTGSSPCGLTAAQGWRVGPLRSTRITRLHRYYEPVRPFASHRYSAPHGSTTWSSPFASRRQVPTFRTRACAGLTPPSCRSPLGQSAGTSRSFVPGQRLEPGFDDVPTLSTRHQRFTHVRLPSAHLTGSSRLFRNAHHPGHWTDAASGGLDPGPAARVRGAHPHLLCSKAASVELTSRPPFRAVVAHSHRHTEPASPDGRTGPPTPGQGHAGRCWRAGAR